MFTPSARRVTDHTDPQVTRDIRQAARQRIDHYRRHPDQINQRLGELDREWDIERTLAAMSSTISLVGLALGLAVNRRLLAIPVIIQTFYLQHALQGWCPPLPVLRRLGVRTQYEIEDERHALKALRGGLASLPSNPTGDRAAIIEVQTVQCL